MTIFPELEREWVRLAQHAKDESTAALSIDPVPARLDDDPAIAGRPPVSRRREHAEPTGREGRQRFGRRPRSRRGWLHVLVPVLATAAVVGVVAVVVLAGGQRAEPTLPGPAPAPSVQVPSPVSLLPPRGGMHGLLLEVSVVGSGSTLRVSFVQCPNCGNGTPPDARELNWSATSIDGGQHWQTQREQVGLLTFGLAVPEDPNVWTFGYGPHAGDPGFYVSHDSGRSYRKASAPSNSGFEPVTLGNGEAWTLGVRCVHYRCRSSVLHGEAAGSSLSQTVTQPPGMPTRRAPTSLMVAGYGEQAYVAEGGHRRLYVTDDEGQSWSPASYPCPAGTLIRDLTSTSGGAVWVTCGPVHPMTTRAGGHPSRKRANPPVTVRRSDDSGRDWQTPDPAFHGTEELVAVTPQIAWANDMSGGLQRTTNGGRSWQTVLRGAGRAPAINIESSTTATVVATATVGTPAAHTRRTDLVAYRTVDGGSHWTHTLIHLPTG
jgi:hypothetical protein